VNCEVEHIFCPPVHGFIDSKSAGQTFESMHNLMQWRPMGFDVSVHCPGDMLRQRMGTVAGSPVLSWLCALVFQPAGEMVSICHSVQLHSMGVDLKAPVMCSVTCL